MLHLQTCLYVKPMDLTELSEHKKDENYSRHPWEQARLEFVYSQIKKQLYQNNSPVFLDIGCGDTYVAEQLLKKIPHASFYCVDTAFTDKQLQSYSEKYSHKSIQVFNNLDKAMLELNKEISFVLALDVMEHVEDDIAFLNTIYNIKNVTKNTNILLTVPAFQSLFTNHDVVLGHFRRYSNNTLEKVIKEAKLQTVAKGYFFASLLIPRLLIKIRENIFKPTAQNTSVSKWNHGKLITRVYKNILIFDFLATSFLEKWYLKPIGLSNYIVCKKPV